MKCFDFNKKQVILAPMAGYSDAPMREMVSHFGVDAVVSEMIASQEWKSEKRGVEARMERGNLAPDTLFIVQIAGRDPALMAEAARFAESLGADQIDINMGCPAKKVTSGATAGAALLLEPQLAFLIVESVASAVNVPVSVKTRLGWSDHQTRAMVRDFENAGAMMLSIHGRTRMQKYSGVADWRAVGEIKSRALVPVIVNGDITSLDDAKQALEQSKADGVMIGRGAIGRPELPAMIRAGLGESENLPRLQRQVLTHFDKILAHYGEEFGVLNARKHLKAYFADRPASWLKALLMERDAGKVREGIMGGMNEEWVQAS